MTTTLRSLSRVFLLGLLFASLSIVPAQAQTDPTLVLDSVEIAAILAGGDSAAAIILSKLAGAEVDVNDPVAVQTAVTSMATQVALSPQAQSSGPAAAAAATNMASAVTQAVVQFSGASANVAVAVQAASAAVT